MFDDPHHPQGAKNVPGNLPLGEPEDMFGDVGDATADGAAVPPPLPQRRVEPLRESAVDAGVLRPKESTAPAAPEGPAILTPPPLEREAPMSVHANVPQVTRGPRMSRVIMVIVGILVVAGVLGAAGWYGYRFVIRSVAAPGAEGIESSGVETVTPPALSPPAEAPVAAPSTDDATLFGGPVDSDGDGLSDADESNIHGTDVHNWDSDGDTLSDYDEAIVWKTDPRNADSDGDTFADGVEVRNGYNPAGPGKIFDPQAGRTTP